MGLAWVTFNWQQTEESPHTPPTCASPPHALRSFSAIPPLNDPQLHDLRLPIPRKLHQQHNLLRNQPAMETYSLLTVARQFRLPMTFAILLLLQLVLLVPLIMLRLILIVYSRQISSVWGSICNLEAINIRRSSSLRALTLEIVKALEGTACRAITGRVANRAFRARKDMLSAARVTNG